MIPDEETLARLCRKLSGNGLLRGIGRNLRKLAARSPAEGERWTVIRDFDGDLELRLDRRSFIGAKIYWTGYHHRRESAWLRKALLPGMTFLDIGANLGEFVVLAAKLAGPQGRVLAFEPMDAMRAQCAGNVAANHFTNVVILPLGLGEDERELQLFGPPALGTSQEMNDGLYTSFPSPGCDLPVQTIPIRRLDEVLAQQGTQRVDIIKIDVEGAELMVLRGAVKTLERDRPRLIVELNADAARAAGYAIGDVVDFLRERKYRLSRFESRGRLVPFAADPARRCLNVLAEPE